MTKRTSSLAAAASAAKRAKTAAAKAQAKPEEPLTGTELSPRVLADWAEAKDFVFATHKDSFDRILSRATSGLVDFPTFLREYAYCVLASGFRARTAAGLLDPILARVHDEEAMLELFGPSPRRGRGGNRPRAAADTGWAGNRSKINAIYTMSQREHEYGELKKQMTDVDSLEALPRIGPIVKHHLARNIGLTSVGKTDLHVVRYAKTVARMEPRLFLQTLAKEVDLPEGAADFIMFVWLMHDRGVEKEGCCHGGLELR